MKNAIEGRSGKQFWRRVDEKVERALRRKLSSTAEEAPNPSIERTVSGKPETAAHVERWAPGRAGK